MEWSDYVREELLRKSCLYSLEVTGGNDFTGVPPIIRVSIDLLNRFLSAGEKYLVMVFPERKEISFLLTVLKIISDILEGRVQSEYNPALFKKGQKLKCKNCIVEFDRLEITNEEQLLWVKNADCSVGIPIDLAPFFQFVETSRLLSKDINFSRIKRQIRKERLAMTSGERLVASLIDNKTHFKCTFFYVSQVNKAKEFTNSVRINGKTIKEILLIGQSDAEGNLKIVNAGQLAGEPAIVLAPDLYAVNEAVKQNSEVKLLLVDVSNGNLIANQLDVLDELKTKGFPVIFLTDTLNSFDLDVLEQRGFWVWRWDEESITSMLYDEHLNQMDQRIKNCACKKIEYISCDERNTISKIFFLLHKNRQDIADAAQNVSVIYDKLVSLVFNLIRAMIPPSDNELILFNSHLEFCENELKAAKRFISPGLYDGFTEMIKRFKLVFEKPVVYPKIEMVKHIIRERKYNKICMIVSDQVDVILYQQYWEAFCSSEKIITAVRVLNQNQYWEADLIQADVTLVCGWLNRDRMKRILYSHKTPEYIVFLYECEERWKNSQVAAWRNVLHKGNKRRVIEKALSSGHSFWADQQPEQMTEAASDEVAEINMVLRENRYRQYGVRSLDEENGDVTKAIPVNYIGGYFGFYKSTHKLISANDIVLHGKNEIRLLNPNKISVGDFVIVREASRDIVKEMADAILENSGHAGLRDLATKWRVALDVEGIFSSFDEIFAKLQNSGCTKDAGTVRQWIKNDSTISPQDKRDLEFIARATDDDVLLEQIDRVYEAGKLVKSAHVQAGRNLSTLLRTQIAQKIQDLGQIDLYNLWEPIPLYIDGVGNVKMLKVIDIGMEMVVETANINRLLSEF
ncbi:DrmE family protein [Propionispora hippei]|uniref:DISARM protein DrmE C-terminal domain-containing protein n=1 Tax=Propionispora hippei DSM 15287 TaxID=1123003 RepID=A0A1M6DYU0_9FIRM|nr:DrmE family protein [Propionispora hippei]SHI78188.1 hypothetical protein SAMN02745170_01051 [Propionispora hippei DSM 15287]